MFNIRELYDAVGRLKRQSPHFHTNCFFFSPKLDGISQKEDAAVLDFGRYILLAYGERDFLRIYYWAESLDVVTELSRKVQELRKRGKVLVMDVVGKQDYAEAVSEILVQGGMERYAALSRYSAKTLREVKETGEEYRCSLVPAEDVVHILPILEESLDPYISHLPPVEYLYELQKNHLIFGSYINGKLVGVECLEPIGKQGRYLYQIAITKTEQHKGIATKMKNYMISCNPDCRHWTVWIEDTNVGSIRINEKTGMKKDGLKDIVLIG